MSFTLNLELESFGTLNKLLNLTCLAYFHSNKCVCIFSNFNSPVQFTPLHTLHFLPNSYRYELKLFCVSCTNLSLTKLYKFARSIIQTFPANCPKVREVAKKSIFYKSSKFPRFPKPLENMKLPSNTLIYVCLVSSSLRNIGGYQVAKHLNSEEHVSNHLTPLKCYDLNHWEVI